MVINMDFSGKRNVAGPIFKKTTSTVTTSRMDKSEQRMHETIIEYREELNKWRIKVDEANKNLNASIEALKAANIYNDKLKEEIDTLRQENERLTKELSSANDKIEILGQLKQQEDQTKSTKSSKKAKKAHENDAIEENNVDKKGYTITVE